MSLSEQALELYRLAREDLSPIASQVQVERVLIEQGIPQPDAIQAAWVASLTLDELVDINITE